MEKVPNSNVDVELPEHPVSDTLTGYSVCSEVGSLISRWTVSDQVSVEMIKWFKHDSSGFTNDFNIVQI